MPVTLLQPAQDETTSVGNPIGFRWTRTADPGSDPHWYEVRLSGPGLDSTWTTSDSSTTFSDVARLQAGSQYTWNVTVRDEFNTTPSAQTIQFYYGASNPNSVPEEHLPKRYALSQNYPNPFNPTTLIRYEIPRTSHVTVRLYNIIGQQVAELVNATQDAGRYQVTVQGSALPTGIYFYRLSAGSFTQTKKLTLLR
jgi:outer membrane receptor for ferrienterochelin and colicin